jgi:hypothetical protein
MSRAILNLFMYDKNKLARRLAEGFAKKSMLGFRQPQSRIYSPVEISIITYSQKFFSRKS